jgi:hypothetical protein
MIVILLLTFEWGMTMGGEKQTYDEQWASLTSTVSCDIIFEKITGHDVRKGLWPFKLSMRKGIKRQIVREKKGSCFRNRKVSLNNLRGLS